MTHHGLCWIGLILALVLGSYASCPIDKCGQDCTSSCIGTCAYDCHKDNCSCRNCPDGMYGEKCTLHCSSNCYSEGRTKLCKRITGECSDGCVNGYCSPMNHCNTPCRKHCTNCDVYDCKCTGCKAGHYGDFCECEHCPETVKMCNSPEMVILILAIICVMILVVVVAWKHYSKKRPTNKDLDSSPGPQQFDRDAYPDAYPLTGNDGSLRYILTQLPNTKELDETFLRMVTEYEIKVIVFISSNRKHELEKYLRFWHSFPLRKVEPRRLFDSYELWPLTLSQNGKAKTTYLYHYSKWFDEKSFYEFTKDVSENPEYLRRPIVVCSSEGKGPSLVYCILDCMMGIKTSEGFQEGLNECAKRLAFERMDQKNMQRLRKCCKYVLRDGQTEVKQTSPWICRIGFIVLLLLFIVIIACTGIMIYKCNV